MPGSAPVPNDAERLRLLIQSTVDYAIFTLDAAGRVANWNSGARRLKGFEADEIIGQHFRVFYTPHAQAAAHPEEELAAAAEIGRYEEEGWRVRKDGSRFWANVVITALRGDDGELLGFGKVTRDLTERKRAEEDLRAALDDLAESQAELVRRERLAAVGQLAAGVAHELGNPLGVISNVHYLLRRALESRGEADAELLRSLATAEREVASATLIVSDLLDFAEARPPRLAPVRVDQLLTEALAIAPPPDGVDVTTASAVVSVEADRDQFRQLVLNLIVNAYEAMPGGGALRVAAEARPTGVRIEVTDTGMGMDENTRARAFEPLFGDKSRGLGLGLAVVRRVVESHGGAITLVSEPGTGTTVTVDLPAKSS